MTPGKPWVAGKRTSRLLVVAKRSSGCNTSLGQLRATCIGWAAPVGWWSRRRQQLGKTPATTPSKGPAWWLVLVTDRGQLETKEKKKH